MGEAQATPVTRVWLITGCASGFGRAFAEAVLASGDRLLATARRVELIQDLVERFPRQVRAVPLDVTRPEEVQAAVDAAIITFGQIDVLVNNAGYALVGAIEEIDDVELRKEFETNVFGTLCVIRATLPHMRARRQGHIINVSSAMGIVGSAALGIYNSTKCAVEGLSEALAVEVAPLGIHVTIVEPGAFRTNWASSSMVQAARRISDYAATSGWIRQSLSAYSGHQPGDPQRAAQALLQIVQASHPPLRLALGTDALANMRCKIAHIEQDLAIWEGMTRSTNYAMNGHSQKVGSPT
ncbi:MAG TPA: oxidoreductase [Ktedonobacteraceae bacterium]|nr:oxidoreductase [Ktedonobacteraceae bacterium]